MALSKRDIQRLKLNRTAIPNKLYIEDPDRNGRSNYFIGTNDRRVRIITQEEYNSIVNPVTPVVNNITTGTTFVAGGDLSGTATVQKVEKILNNVVPVDAVGALTNDGVGGLTWTVPGGAGTVTTINASTGITLTPNPIVGVGSVALTVPVTEILGGTNQTTYTTGDILYASAANTLSKLPIGTVGQVCTVAGGLPSWATPSSVTPAALSKVDDTNVTLTLGGTPLTALLQATSLTLGWAGTLADARIASAATWNAKQDAISLTTLGTSGAATFIANTLNIPQYSGGASPLTTKGDLYTFSTVDARLAIGATNGMFLQVASGATTGNQWSPYTLPVAVPTVGKILRSDGTNMLGTTATYPDTVTSGRLIMASASNVVSDVAMSGDATITNAGVITVTSLANLKKGSFGATWNGQGGVITNSNIAVAEIVVPANGNITDFVIESYYMVAGVPTYLSGSIVLDLYASGASMIGAGNKPTLSSASTSSAAVAGWTTTAVTAGDKLFVYIVGSPVTCLVVTVTFKYTKT